MTKSIFILEEITRFLDLVSATALNYTLSVSGYFLNHWNQWFVHHAVAASIIQNILGLKLNN